jgi:hypothetical protein
MVFYLLDTWVFLSSGVDSVEETHGQSCSRQMRFNISPADNKSIMEMVFHLHFKIHFSSPQMLVMIFLWALLSNPIGSFYLFQSFHGHCGEVLVRHDQKLPVKYVFNRMHLAKVMQPAGGKAKSSMQGFFLSGKSSIFRTTCLSCPVRPWVIMWFSKWQLG